MGKKKQHVWDLVGAYPVCPSCGSRSVYRDAWARWSLASRDWQLKSIFDHFVCDKCGDQILPDWKVDSDFRRARIRRLNDAVRRGQALHATCVVTSGVQALGDEAVRQACRTVAWFDDFSEENDPHGEHDFGSFDLKGEKLFWKIDYFDLDLTQHSEDAANPDCTHRVLTIMLASEY